VKVENQLENTMISNPFTDTIISTKLDCDKTLVELTNYQGTYLWWFVDHDFRCFIAKLLGEHIGFIRFNEVLLTAYAKTDIFQDLASHLLSRAIMKLSQRDRMKRGKRKIAFTDQNRSWQTILDYERRTSKKSDAFFDSIILELKSTHEIVGIYPIGRTIKGIRVFVDKIINWDIHHYPFEFFWSIAIWTRTRRASAHFRHIWKDMQELIVLKKLCQYQQRDLYKAISHRLRFYFLILFPLIVKKIEMAKKMIESEKPNLILLENEYGNFERALVVAGKLKKIPIMAIQHGTIWLEGHVGLYIFNKAFKSQVALPCITCVSGSYFKEMLVEKSIYDPDQIAVTGAPRYDILFHLNRIGCRKEILRRIGVNPDHKIVLWTTGCQALSWEENIKNFEVMKDIFRDLQAITLIVKQHPGEGAKHTKLIKKKLLTKRLPNITLVPKDANTYEFLKVCDLLITKASTTALEAIALNKPVIILDLSGEESTIEYVREGVALAVYSKNALKEGIRQLLHDDSALTANRPSYIENHLHQIDGNATRRVIDLITRLSGDNLLPESFPETLRAI
jgi:UDP-N-acetylglucosamine 2-epimerase